MEVSPDAKLLDVFEASQPRDDVLRLYVELTSLRQGERKPGAAENKIHPHVVCDECQGPVRGARFRCLQCPDYDLCSVCEDKGIHTEHVMVKSYRPGFFRKVSLK